MSASNGGHEAATPAFLVRQVTTRPAAIAGTPAVVAFVEGSWRGAVSEPVTFMLVLAPGLVEQWAAHLLISASTAKAVGEAGAEQAHETCQRLARERADKAARRRSRRQ